MHLKPACKICEIAVGGLYVLPDQEGLRLGQFPPRNRCLNLRWFPLSTWLFYHHLKYLTHQK